MRSLVNAALLCAIGTSAQQPFNSMKNIFRQHPNEFARSFLGGHMLQQQNPSSVNIKLNDRMSIDAYVGSENISLSLVPMINTGFSGLYDVSCEACQNVYQKYNVSGSNTSLSGTNNITKITSSDSTDFIEGKAIRDSFCLDSQLNNTLTCDQSNTSTFYEFFLIVNTSSTYNNDGFIGLAPGEYGFKSYPEYLIDRKVISKNTVGMKINELKT